MKSLIIRPPDNLRQVPITLPLSKSIANRMLVIDYLSGTENSISIPESDDSLTMLRLLSKLRDQDHKGTSELIPEYNAGDAGTVFRFLSPLLAISEGDKVLTGSPRMLERPCGQLFTALKSLGARFSYLKKDGYPPVLINGTMLNGGNVSIDASVSSQFITALMLIAPVLPLGLTIELIGEQVSKPYIDLTCELMRSCGITIRIDGNIIIIPPGKYKNVINYYEGDWSAASYWYVAVALMSQPASIILRGLKEDSMQGDRRVFELFDLLGVTSSWQNHDLHIRNNGQISKSIEIDLTKNPDLAPSLAVACAALEINTKLTGLKTLVIKESNRLLAISNELNKLGYNCRVENHESLIISGEINLQSSNEIDTYNDHRIAMAMSLLSIKRGALLLKDPSVVSKSYPSFWNDLESVGFSITK